MPRLHFHVFYILELNVTVHGFNGRKLEVLGVMLLELFQRPVLTFGSSGEFLRSLEIWQRSTHGSETTQVELRHRRVLAQYMVKVRITLRAAVVRMVLYFKR